MTRTIFIICSLFEYINLVLVLTGVWTQTPLVSAATADGALAIALTLAALSTTWAPRK